MKTSEITEKDASNDDAKCCAPTCCAPDESSTSGASAAGLQADDPNSVRAEVKKQYAQVALSTGGCCGPESNTVEAAKRASLGIGYTAEQLAEVGDANMGVGCGNPTALASLKPGQVVLDLGSGAGIDALLAAKQVGAEGRVIGVDMTPEMLERSRVNAVEAGVARNVEFREGTIEELPVASDSIDVVISNCVINLSPDKPSVFREAHRVLREGGRLVVSDILLSKPLPDVLRNHTMAYAACIGGAVLEQDYLQALKDAGFNDVTTTRRPAGGLLEAALDVLEIREAAAALPAAVLDEAVGNLWSYDIEARKG